MIQPLPPVDFIKQHLETNWLLLDSRSEKEYEHAHIPGAVNLPLLNNEHRHLVGITYKKEGKEAAVEKGFELAGPKFGEYVKQVKAWSEGREVLLYCWRGGMRSGIMSWILKTAGFRVHVLQGGYKEFRSWALGQFEEPRMVAVIGGKTGAGKTEVLHALRKMGEQTIDLEGLAHHKGSAFGALGEKPQPSCEQFENLLAIELHQKDKQRVLWLENESRNIGMVKIPDGVYEQIRSSTLFEMDVEVSERSRRIMQEYGSFSKAELQACTGKLSKRLGDRDTRLAVSALEDGRMSDWLQILLEYYDKSYSYSRSIRTQENCLALKKDPEESVEKFASRLLAFAHSTLNTITI